MEGDALNIWVLDKDESFAQKLKTVVAQSEHIQCERIFLAFSDLYKNLSREQENDPDLLVISSQLCEFSREESLASLKADPPGISVLVVSKDANINLIHRAFRNGAKGCIHKESLQAHMVKAVEVVSEGGIYISPDIADQLMRLLRITIPEVDYGLTNREKEILKGLADGYSQQEIANTMFISPYTVNSHLQNIYKKLQVNTGIQAVSKALTEKII